MSDGLFPAPDPVLVWLTPNVQDVCAPVVEKHTEDASCASS